MALSEKRRNSNQENLGGRLRARREAQGFTQKQLAAALGVEYYTMISQMELGYMAIPPALWAPIATALNIQDKERWIIDCLEATNPEIAVALFNDLSTNEIVDILIKAGPGRNK